MKKAILFILFLSFSVLTNGQIKKIIHQVFKLDTVSVIKVGLWEQSDTYIWEVEEWPSRNIMIETNISLNQASSAILNFMIEAKRYDLKIREEGDNFFLENELEERMEIKTAEGVSTEEIRLRIFMPDIYEKVDDTTWKKIQKQKNTENN